MKDSSFTMSFAQAKQYVIDTKTHVFAVLQDGLEVTMYYGESEIIAEVFIFAFNVWLEHSFMNCKEMQQRIPDVENVLWRIGESPLFIKANSGRL